ncbi:MAG: metallophosphatase domain-containing protein [Elusimicrobia bacterium]|nr:metallophosphatase domain-containing protein [Elusimicrobiota bacterium]
MRICVISDTHGFHASLKPPRADLLLCAGDVSLSGGREEIAAFAAWWRALDYPRKLLIAGNHDWLFQRQPRRARELFAPGEYLQDSEARVGRLRVWGSPWQPWFMDWAFNLKRGTELKAKWDLIPDGVDILLTHGPPRGFGDLTRRGPRAGCRELLQAVAKRVRPRWHVFGHIHEAYGVFKAGSTTFINASICDFWYRPAHRPVVFEAG